MFDVFAVVGGLNMGVVGVWKGMGRLELEVAQKRENGVQVGLCLGSSQYRNKSLI